MLRAMKQCLMTACSLLPSEGTVRDTILDAANILVAAIKSIPISISDFRPELAIALLP
jgi:hypothetical protein